MAEHPPEGPPPTGQSELPPGASRRGRLSVLLIAFLAYGLLAMMCLTIALVIAIRYGHIR